MFLLIIIGIEQTYRGPLEMQTALGESSIVDSSLGKRLDNEHYQVGVQVCRREVRNTRLKRETDKARKNLRQEICKRL